MKRTLFGVTGRVAAALLLCSGPIWGADRCSDAHDDIVRAKALAESGQDVQARKLLRSAFLACPMDAQNLELQAEVNDVLGDFEQAGNQRTQAWRLRGISKKPEISFSTSSPAIERGQTAEIKWTTQYATEVTLGPEFGRVPARGTKTVAPDSTATYEVKARGPGGSAASTVVITVTIPRLTEANIADLLQNGVPTERVAKLVADRGVAFQLDPEAEKRLRDAGADDVLIDSLKKARH